MVGRGVPAGPSRTITLHGSAGTPRATNKKAGARGAGFEGNSEDCAARYFERFAVHSRLVGSPPLRPGLSDVPVIVSPASLPLYLVTNLLSPN
jgi:hypothetical protein